MIEGRMNSLSVRLTSIELKSALVSLNPFIAYIPGAGGERGSSLVYRRLAPVYRASAEVYHRSAETYSATAGV
jgi:hypothetical protein